MSGLTYRELARWGRLMGTADAAARDAGLPQSARHLSTFCESNVHQQLDGPARRLFCLAYARAYDRAAATRAG